MGRHKVQKEEKAYCYESLKKSRQLISQPTPTTSHHIDSHANILTSRLGTSQLNSNLQTSQLISN